MRPEYQPLLSEKEIHALMHGQTKTPLTGQSFPLNGYQQGEEPAGRIGAGSDFAEVRHYYPGDDPRLIDWRATARSSVPLVRTFYTEQSRPMCIVIDRTDTMRYASRVRLKAAQALRLALHISAQQLRINRELSFIILDQSSHYLPAGQGINSLKIMLKYANLPCPPLEDAHAINWLHTLSGIRQHIDRGTELILISDFNSMSEKHQKSLKTLGQYSQCQAVHIYDTSELSPQFPDAVELTWQCDSIPLGRTISNVHLKQLLSQRADELKQWFMQANIYYNRLSVEQQELL